jgi:hypothetical protein
MHITESIPPDLEEGETTFMTKPCPAGKTVRFAIEEIQNVPEEQSYEGFNSNQDSGGKESKTYGERSECLITTADTKIRRCLPACKP